MGIWKSARKRVKWTRKKERNSEGSTWDEDENGTPPTNIMILVQKSLRNFFDRLISQRELQRKEHFVDFLSWEWQTENTIESCGGWQECFRLLGTFPRLWYVSQRDWLTFGKSLVNKYVNQLWMREKFSVLRDTNLLYKP